MAQDLEWKHHAYRIARNSETTQNRKAYKHCGVVLEDTTLRMTTNPSKCRALHSPKHFCYRGKHISRFSSLTNWQPNNWLENSVSKLMITAIKSQRGFYSQNSYQTPGCKCRKINQTNPHLQAGIPAQQPRTDLCNAIEFMVKFISLQQNTRKVHLNWPPFLVEAALLNCICLPAKTSSLKKIIFLNRN